jgi:hypothetical protein
MRRSKNKLSSKKNHRKKLTQIRKQSKREEENLSDSQTLLSICDKIKLCVCCLRVNLIKRNSYLYKLLLITLIKSEHHHMCFIFTLIVYDNSQQ